MTPLHFAFRYSVERGFEEQALALARRLFAVYDEALPWPRDDDDGMVQVQWREACSRPFFDAALDRIQCAIAEGELYQVNFTAPLHGVLRGGPEGDAALALFAALQRAQPGGYAAYLDTGDEQVLSVSPELFFDWHAGRILTRPMKGTAPRGATPAEDAARADALRTSAKERAENVMIVDLLRNDLSRIAEPFSVRVPRLFHTEALATVWQMTSDVEAHTRAACSLAMFSSTALYTSASTYRCSTCSSTVAASGS